MANEMVEVKFTRPAPHDTDLAVMRMLVTLAAYHERDPNVRNQLIRMARSRDYIEIGQMAENLRLYLDVML